MKTFHDYDKRDVRVFVGYQETNGCFKIEIRRKKLSAESDGETDWKMVRIGHIQSYTTRQEAEKIALELCEKVCDEFGY